LGVIKSYISSAAPDCMLGIMSRTRLEGAHRELRR